MSLYQIAQHLQDAGRNGDSMLVHMTPGEVSGLQALAKAHGGSLTINPETGLPESFFLAAILPTILGAGMQAAGMSALNAALLTGAIGTAVTGDLGQGIMAGLGAYGGAGLAGGLSKMGTAAPQAPAMNVATHGVEGMKQGLYGLDKPIFSTASNIPNAAAAANFRPFNPMQGLPSATSGALPIPTNLPTDATAASLPYQSTMDKFGAGLKRLTGEGGFKELRSAMEAEAPGSGLASVASPLGSSMFGKKAKPPESKSLIRPYRFERRSEPGGYGDTGYGTSERRYFDDEYIELEPYAAPGPEYAAEGGLMGIARFASGGFPTNTGEYVRYTGTRPLDPYKDDYYYVGGMNPHFMIRKGSSGDTAEKTGTYDYDYDREIGKFVQKSGPGMPTTPKLSTDPQAYTAETLNPVYQQYFGRDVDPEGIAAYTKREFSPFELDTILKASPEYAARQQQLAAAKKEASYATATQAANMYRDLLGRTIDPEGLKYYTQEQRMTPAELKKTLMQSEEYLTKLTKPLAPKPFVTHSGAIGLEGAMRTPEQEAARPRDMSNFYAMMDRRLAEQAQRQQQQPEYAVGGSVEQMSAMNSVGDNLMYPQSQFQTPMYSNPMMQRPMPVNVISTGLDAPVNSYTGEQKLASGGLGSYSDGGRLLRGPGDGVSDSIPAVIGKHQPARLADGEFVVPARIVSELGNGSTEAGARKLYAMMDRVQKARKKSVGKNKVAVNSRADKHLPA